MAEIENDAQTHDLREGDTPAVEENIPGEGTPDDPQPTGVKPEKPAKDDDEKA